MRNRPFKLLILAKARVTYHNLFFVDRSKCFKGDQTAQALNKVVKLIKL